MRRSRTVALCLIPLILLGGCLALSGRTTTTVPEVERKVDQALPVGSTRQEIETWLTAQGIEFGSSDAPGTFDSFLRSVPDIGRYPSSVEAIIRKTDRSLFVSGDIQLYFLLGADNRLEKRLVRWIGTGP